MADAWDGVDTEALSGDATAAVFAVRAARADAAAWERRYTAAVADAAKERAELLAENRKLWAASGRLLEAVGTYDSACRTIAESIDDELWCRAEEANVGVAAAKSILGQMVPLAPAAG